MFYEKVSSFLVLLDGPLVYITSSTDNLEGVSTRIVLHKAS